MATVRIKEESHAILQHLAAVSGQSMRSILEKAIEDYRRKLFLEQANQSFAALRNDSKAWKEEQKEREIWDTTLSDGLEKV